MENPLPPAAVLGAVKNASRFELDSTLAPGCPWTDLRTEYGLPNVNWCEETLCQWISEPANVWSNLGYAAAAVFFIYWIRREKLTHPVLRTFPVAAVLVGLCSALYHASVTYAFQLLDFAGMYLFLFLPIGFQAVRLGWIPTSRFRIWYGAKIVGATAFTWVLSQYTAFPIQLLIILLIAFLFGLEIYAYRHAVSEGWRYSLRWLGASFVAICGALACSVVDVNRIHCNPGAHGWFEQGHALWHWLGAVALSLSILHYSQFERGSRSGQT